jgi:hypothetical protein
VHIVINKLLSIYIFHFIGIPIQDRVFFYLQTVGIIPRLMVHERNQMFITVESRLKTFDTLYIKLSVNLITLCEAGFFYEGIL